MPETERRTPADLVTQWRERADERERRANATSDLMAITVYNRAHGQHHV